MRSAHCKQVKKPVTLTTLQTYPFGIHGNNGFRVAFMGGYYGGHKEWHLESPCHGRLFQEDR